MDLGFDLENGLHGQRIAGGHGEWLPLDWHGLRARFLAAQACHAALAAEGFPTLPAVARGSFAPGAASLITARSGFGQCGEKDGSRDVNPAGLGNGKADWRIEAGVAAQCRTGDRGLK